MWTTVFKALTFATVAAGAVESKLQRARDMSSASTFNWTAVSFCELRSDRFCGLTSESNEVIFLHEPNVHAMLCELTMRQAYRELLLMSKFILLERSNVNIQHRCHCNTRTHLQEKPRLQSSCRLLISHLTTHRIVATF